MTISQKEYFDLLSGLVGIPSFSRDETAACDYLEAWLRAKGFDPARKGNNLWMSSDCGGGSDKPTLLLNAHIDTVKPSPSYTRDPFKATLDGDTLYGLGTNDDGGSLAALLAVYACLSETVQPYRLVWSATAEEEVSGVNGLEAILDEIGPVALGIIGEPTGMRMAVAEKGLMVLDCTAHGKSGHAARDEGENALYKALEDIEWFRTHRFDKVSEYLGPVRMGVTMISAGTQHNVVPDECRFVVDVRPNGMYTNIELLGMIKDAVRCDVKERSVRINSSQIGTDHPVVARAMGLGIVTFGSPTTSNMAVSPFPTVKIGPGESSRSHTADEYILVSEIENGIETYIRLLDGLKI